MMMIRSYKFLIILSVLTIVMDSSVRTETLSPALTAKLHPSLRALAGSHEKIFYGASVFQSFGAAPSEIGVLVYTTDFSALRASGVRIQSVVGRAATARIRVDDLETLCKTPGVDWIDPGTINYPLTDISIPETGAILLQTGFIGATPYTGKGVIILIYDTGIDFQHPDFRSPSDPSRSRILSIWDQTLTPMGDEISPQGFSYGVEYSNAEIEAELTAVPAGVVREKDTFGHGTHVAGIAAGNGMAAKGKYVGMAPEADIVVVKGGNTSFSEVNMIDGLQYAENVAMKYGKPVVVNWSIGGQRGPHDGTRAYEAAVNTFSSKPGRVVCISAGNDGSSVIHRSGTLLPGIADTITAIVPPFIPASGTENDAFTLDVWTRDANRVDASVLSPGGISYAMAAETDGDCTNVADGTISLWNHNASTLNSNRNIQLYVHDKTASTPKPGAWKLALKNTSASGVQYDVWLSSRTVGGSAAVTLSGGDNDKTVSMPGTAAAAITVGSYVTKWSWPSMIGQIAFSGADRTNNISIFSSIGPTADGRQKPDITAPGQGIFAAMSSMSAQANDSVYRAMAGKHYLMNGTSMASPHAAGACALLLSADPALTAQQIKSLLLSAANTDGYTARASMESWGYGKLDVAEAMARLISPSAVLTRTVLAYDSSGANTMYTLTGAMKLGVRITPQTSGALTRGIINLTTSNNHPIAGGGAVVCELFSNNNGVPGTRIGAVSSLPMASLSPGSLNTIPFAAPSASVMGGCDYFFVVSLSNPSDTLKLRTDGAVSDVRSVVLKDGTWSRFANNFRIRSEIASTQGVNGVSDDQAPPLEFELHQNFPNPFNPSTVIVYTTPERGHVSLKIFDVLGREVSTLVQEEQSAGRHRALWNGRTSQGTPASAGVYFYRLQSGASAKAHRMLLLK